jgi:hypothetical protein
MYLECHGTDSPTVILESGYHDSSQPWSLSDGYPPAVLAGLVFAVPIRCRCRLGAFNHDKIVVLVLQSRG